MALAGGRVVSAARLVEDLWGARTPDTAPRMVQIHVSTLRKVLPAGVLVTRAPGYAVDLSRVAVDAFRAEDAPRAGRDALAVGDPLGASGALAGALALWRGAALEELGEPFADGEARRFAELRLALTEERLAADLALGRHADAIREIEALALDPAAGARAGRAAPGSLAAASSPGRRRWSTPSSTGSATARPRCGAASAWCSTGASEAYMPMLQALERMCRAPGAGDALPALVGRAPT